MNVIIMILLISLLILVHELGHFLAARALGIKVDKFGFGLPFGPVLFKGKIGDTEILIHALLLGGYVSFPDDDENSDLPKDSGERFKNKSIGQRAIVISAGVIANVLCAAVLVVMVAVFWHKLPAGKYDIFVSKIIAPKGAAVYDSGLQKDDKLYKINGSVILYPFAVNKFAQMSRQHDGFVAPKVISENLKELEKLNPSIKDASSVLAQNEIIKLPALKDEPEVKLSNDALVGLEKTKNTETELTKVQTELRDEIQNVKNPKTYTVKGNVTLNDIAAAVSDTQKPMMFTVIREDKEVNLKPIYSDKTGVIGIQQVLNEVLTPTDTPKKIVTVSADYLWSNTKMMVVGLTKLFTGQIPMQDLHGIVAITKLGGDVIENQGLFKGILLTAIISLNLALINILPIPALDGGHLLFLIIEKIKGRPIEESTIEKIGNIGFTILLVLMFLIIFNDIFALVTKQI